MDKRSSGSKAMSNSLAFIGGVRLLSASGDSPCLWDTTSGEVVQTARAGALPLSRLLTIWVTAVTGHGRWDRGPGTLSRP